MASKPKLLGRNSELGILWNSKKKNSTDIFKALYVTSPNCTTHKIQDGFPDV